MPARVPLCQALRVQIKQRRLHLKLQAMRQERRRRQETRAVIYVVTVEVVMAYIDFAYIVMASPKGGRPAF